MNPKTTRPMIFVLIGFLMIPVLAIAVVVSVRVFFVQTYYAANKSMSPTIEQGESFRVGKYSYWFSDPKRGDIVVIQAPELVESPAVKVLIKRVVAIEGETIEGKCRETKTVCDVQIFVNSKLINEKYLPEGINYAPFAKQAVPKGSVFVMGDERNNSMDSRTFGPINRSTIVGKVL